MSLRALVSGKALNVIRHLEVQANGFEAWRLLHREYKPDTATRKVGLLERVMEDAPTTGEDFGDWFLRWLALVGQTEQARGRRLDDDIKIAMVLKRAPNELRDHLVIETARIADKFPIMREIVENWSYSRRTFRNAAPRASAMEVGAVADVGHSTSDASWVGAVGWKGSTHSYDGWKGSTHGYDGWKGSARGSDGWNNRQKGFHSMGKGKGKGKGFKGKSVSAYGYGKTKGSKKGGEDKGSGKGGRPKGYGWNEPFRGYCGCCWQWGHKKAQCPSLER